MCIIETMCRAGQDLAIVGPSADASTEAAWGTLDDVALQDLDQLVSRVEKYCHEYRNVEKELVRPFSPRRKDAAANGQDEESDDEDLFSEEVSLPMFTL